jgi:hypothetical protein
MNSLQNAIRCARQVEEVEASKEQSKGQGMRWRVGKEMTFENLPGNLIKIYI